VGVNPQLEFGLDFWDLDWIFACFFTELEFSAHWTEFLVASQRFF